MIRVYVVLMFLSLAGCAQNTLPDDFDSSFEF